MPHALFVTPTELPFFGLSREFVSEFDPTTLQSIGQAVTDLILGWIKPTLTPPILSWGADFKLRAAHVYSYFLRSNKGMAPPGANVGDDNVRALYKEGEEWFKRVGLGDEDPTDLVDSGDSDGPTGGFRARAQSDDPVGF